MILCQPGFPNETPKDFGDIGPNTDGLNKQFSTDEIEKFINTARKSCPGLGFALFFDKETGLTYARKNGAESISSPPP